MKQVTTHRRTIKLDTLGQGFIEGPITVDAGTKLYAQIAERGPSAVLSAGVITLKGRISDDPRGEDTTALTAFSATATLDNSNRTRGGLDAKPFTHVDAEVTTLEAGVTLDVLVKLIEE